MKTLAIVLVCLLAEISPAQTNEQIIRVKEYRAEHWTNQITLGERSGPRRLHGEVTAVYKTRFKLTVDDRFIAANDGKEIIIQNYPSLEELANGQKLSLMASEIGTIRGMMADGTPANGVVLELWDYYDEQAELVKREIEAENARQYKRQIQQEIEARKTFAGQSNAIRWLQPQASNGSASAQCSLGLHYLKGEGCEANQALAIYWLQKAADQGDAEAIAKLKTITPKK